MVPPFPHKTCLLVKDSFDYHVGFIHLYGELFSILNYNLLDKTDTRKICRPYSTLPKERSTDGKFL